MLQSFWETLGDKQSTAAQKGFPLPSGLLNIGWKYNTQRRSASAVTTIKKIMVEKIEPLQSRMPINVENPSTLLLKGFF